jgi:hypothetical protein
MFSIPKVNVVSSNESFYVEVLGRTGIEYREGDKSTFVDSEILATGHGIAVFKNSIKAWRPPHDKEEITAEQRQQIIENIRRAIEFQKQPVEIL